MWQASSGDHSFCQAPGAVWHAALCMLSVLYSPYAGSVTWRARDSHCPGSRLLMLRRSRLAAFLLSLPLACTAQRSTAQHVLPFPHSADMPGYLTWPSTAGMPATALAQGITWVLCSVGQGRRARQV